MADPSLTPPPPPPAPESQTPTPNSNTDFDISEEYGTARKNLPPARILAICIAVVAVIALIYSLTHRAHPLSTGSIDDVVAVPIPGQDETMVAINISVQNTEQKPIWIKSIKASAEVNGQQYSDDASPATDVERYFQAMPDLKQHALELLTTDKQVNPESKISGTIVVSFPVKPDAFAARKSLSVSIMPYNELPVVIKK
ncbi:MAG TPA: hypothetical protein VF133_20455 [Terriglobales bacterium]